MQGLVAGMGRVGRVACWACRVGSGFLACRGVLRIQRSVLAVSVPFRVAACVLDGPCRVGSAPVIKVGVFLYFLLKKLRF